MNRFQKTLQGIMAGLLIILGCAVYLASASIYAGALLFCVALLGILMMGYALFTGKVGFLAKRCTRGDAEDVLLSLLGNALGTLMFGTLLRLGLPSLCERAAALCAAKLVLPLSQALIRAYFCGALMYLAVAIYRARGSALGVFLCVPAFILSGFEHSIADMGYFAVAGVFSLRTLAFLAAVIVGNSLGALTLPLLSRLCRPDQN